MSSPSTGQKIEVDGIAYSVGEADDSGSRGHQSPAQRAREKRQKTRGDYYCRRPDDLPSNSPLPKYGYLVMHAMIESDWIVYRALKTLDPVLLAGGFDRGGLGELVRHAGIPRIAAATAEFTASKRPMPTRTVAHRLQAMDRKGIIVRWEQAATALHASAGSSWRIPPWDEILERWKNNPAIATVSPRVFYVIGKGKRHLTPAEFVAWKLDQPAAEKNPAARASGRASGGTADEQQAPTQSAPPPIVHRQPEAPGRSSSGFRSAAESQVVSRFAAPPELPELDLQLLKDALTDCCDGASLQSTHFVWRKIQKACGRHEMPSVETAAALVHAVAKERRKIGNRNPINIGLMAAKVCDKVELWRREQSRAAGQAAIRERDERTARINQLISTMWELEELGSGEGEIHLQPDLTVSARSHYESVLAAADPVELERARQLAIEIKARRSG